MSDVPGERTQPRKSSKLRVVLLCVGWPGRHEVGGAARYAWRFAEMIRDQVELHIITSEGGIPLPGATMHVIPNRGGRFAHYYLFPLKVRRLLRKMNFDVLHAFGDDWAISHRRFAWVRTFHGSSRSEARASSGLRRWNHYLLAALEHSVRRRCDVALAVGPEGETEFRTDALVPPVLPRSVRFSAPVPSACPTVVFIGTYAGRKRGALAADVVKQVSRNLNRSVSLRVVGPAADADHWPPTVKHYANPTDAEVRELVGQSWLLLAPSTYEGFGIPAFEAASLGVPSISSPNPGSEFLARHIQLDDLFSVVNDHDLVDAVQRRIARGPLPTSPEVRSAVAAADALADRASTDNLLSLYSETLERALGHERP
ncbi:glycosyltransferase family 4 protein [Microbacterium sp. PRF11]|uniref:glycosyltransferase family 4 protein n=1 Tax=Microbacterium sp. PRF11 TaxID=2962593 RepID=UPI0037CC69D7